MINLLAANGETAYNVNEYVIDSPDDIKNLPKHCKMGSSALIISTGEVYIKNGLGEWVKI